MFLFKASFSSYGQLELTTTSPANIIGLQKSCKTLHRDRPVEITKHKERLQEKASPHYTVDTRPAKTVISRYKCHFLVPKVP